MKPACFVLETSESVEGFVEPSLARDAAPPADGVQRPGRMGGRWREWAREAA